MFIARRSIKYLFLVPIVIVILICPLSVRTTAEISSIGYEVPIYKIPIPENTQRDIWKQCENNNLSYELVYYRDYWTGL